MKKSNGTANRLVKSFLSENSVLRLALGICPALAVTASAVSGFSMGILTLIVLVCSNLTMYALRRLIPKSVCIPVYLIITALFVTVLQILSKTFLPVLSDMLGIYFPLITVNCVIIGSAKSSAEPESAVNILLDSLIMGAAFALTLSAIGIIRELIGCGTVFGFAVTKGYIQPLLLAVTVPGGFLTLGFLAALVNKIADKDEKKAAEDAEYAESSDYAENGGLSENNSGEEEDITL